MSETSPSALLSAAAARIRDLAAAATQRPWKRYQDEGYISVYAGPYPLATAFETQPDRNAEWVCALSPAVAPHLEVWLRHSAAMWATSERRGMDFGGDPKYYVGALEESALELAKLICPELGVGTQ